MESTAIIICALIGAAIAIGFALRRARSKRVATDALNAAAPDISRLYDQIAKLEAFESGYLMKKDWDALLESANPVLAAVARVPQKAVESSALAEQISFVTQRCQNPTFREERNRAYKVHELIQCDDLLSDVDGGKSIDPQQRNAIVTDEYSNLVIAGAGSGKTSVVVGKVKYLVERWGIDPSQILVTSFTRASVDDLRSRIVASGIEGVSARTFHSLGLRVLGNEYAVAPENALARHVTSYLSNELAAHPNQAAALLEFFGLWSLSPCDSPDSQEAEVRMKLLKAQDMRTLKGFVEESKREAGMDTLLGERVKSTEELMIANYLFLNGVTYEYEKPYPYAIPEELRAEGRRAYQPDFYLTDYDIWLEHFGIDENGLVPWMKTSVEQQNYIDGIEWKRKLHARCGTKLIESYSYWNKDQDLLNKLEALLKANGIALVIDPERNAAICGEPRRRVSIEYQHAPALRPKGRSQNARPTCPKCGVPMVVRSGAYGKFYGCPNFPRFREKKQFDRR